MNNINAYAVGMRAADVARALRAASDFAARPAHVIAPAHVTATAAARKRRTATAAFVDGGII